VTTFLIIEDDSYGEQPHIYVKIYPDLVFISDTGCNSPRQRNMAVTSLRQYLETFPVPANNGSPLNPNGGKPYLILCTHCHYDHILGIPPFLSSPDDNPTILASAHDKSFILTHLPTHSLCKYLHIPTPSYHISHWARHLEYLSYTPPSPAQPPTPLRIQLLHIPGHTADSLAWYDIDAHHLYIGDMFYERKRDLGFPIPRATEGLPTIDDAPIIFPSEGNWIAYLSSLSLLLSFIRHQNFLLQLHWASEPIHEKPPEHRSPPRVKLGAGHVTADGDAEIMTREVEALFRRIIARKVPVGRSLVRRGEVFDYWCEGEEALYSVLAPRRLVEEARGHFEGEGG
jgi:glyoxylase-like metal-dependent hydrolase (beta-lactamase superfamily II)